SNEKITPWNFDQQVNFIASAENFIRKMTNNCTYLLGEEVIPKKSLLYTKFEVLNELNKIRVNDKLIEYKTKMEIINDIFLVKKKIKEKDIVPSCLYLASGVMISISIIDLIPSSMEIFSRFFNLFPSIILMSIFLSFGIIISFLIDHFLPSEIAKEKGLYHVGIITMITIIIHNVLEGMLTFLTTKQNPLLGLNLSVAIMFHNIPEGISIAIPIYYSTLNKKKAIFYTLLSGFSEPIGALLALFFLNDLASPFFMGAIYSVSAGIMQHMAIYELIPNALKYKKKKAIIFFFIGVLIMTLTTIIITK
ncbi:MAG: CRISPR-associated endonuclease Cas9 REC1/REC2 domain-containing protein, partial [Bacilli bacterium]